jgi:arabinogalactan endo-1,4-beta-galactosidase
VRGLTRRELGLSALATGALFTLPAGAAVGPERPGAYILGADISWIPEDEAAGAEYYLDGKRQDIFTILTGAGFNWVRLRLFVNPENGYSAGKKDSPWCGLEQTIKLARRVKAAGMKIALTFHYSDTWADPQHQDKPAAWKDLSFPDLERAVEAHTRDSLNAMKAAGVLPDMVHVGNEVTFGMLWPEGRVALPVPTGNPATDAVHLKPEGIGGYDQFAILLKAGIKATREVAPKASIMLHNHLGRHWVIVREWTDALLSRGVDFDLVGFSCYQQLAEGDWERTFTEFVKRYPKLGFCAVEYSGRKEYLNDLVFNAPGKRGWGSFIWEPTRHQEAVFDKDGRNAGGGAKPNLLSQGINAAEAPGAVQPGTPLPPPPSGPKRHGEGGRYEANQFLELYRGLSRKYGSR